MARRKKPEGETMEEARVRLLLSAVADNSTRSEKVSWDRKMDGMVRLLSTLTPIEDKITALLAKKMPIIDEIQVLRDDMVDDCVHPYSHLVLKTNSTGDEYVECKFCNRKFSVGDEQQNT